MRVDRDGMRESADVNSSRQCRLRSQPDSEGLVVFGPAVVPDGEHDILCLQSAVAGKRKHFGGGNCYIGFGSGGEDSAESGVFAGCKIDGFIFVIDTGKGSIKVNLLTHSGVPELNL